MSSDSEYAGSDGVSRSRRSSGTPSPSDAGPSSAPAPAASTSTAPWRHYQRATYGSVEYLGPVSHPSALLDVADQAAIDDCFNGAPTKDVPLPVLELHYGGEARPTAIPVRGHRVPSAKLLLRVKKRRRRGGAAAAENGGYFTAEVVGTVSQTVRFRAMADFQYTPSRESGVAELVDALHELDYETILDWKFPDLHEDWVEPGSPGPDGAGGGGAGPRSLLDLQPTPQMNPKPLPHHFSYRPLTALGVKKYRDPETGEMRERLFNKSRNDMFQMQRVRPEDPLGAVPAGPDGVIQDKMKKMRPDILARMQERPMWKRFGIMCNLSEQDARTVDLCVRLDAQQKFGCRLTSSDKTYFPSVGYTFATGPFRSAVIRFGFDPRESQSSHIYQRVSYVIHVNRDSNKYLAGDIEGSDEEREREREQSEVSHAAHWVAETKTAVDEGRRPPVDRTKAYMFDGVALNSDVPDLLMCDITDPQIAAYVQDKRGLLDECHPKHGWYRPEAMELIREMFRAKQSYMRRHHTPAPELLTRFLTRRYERLLRDEARKARDARRAVGDEAEDDEGDDVDEDDDDDDDDDDDSVDGQEEAMLEAELKYLRKRTRRAPKPMAPRAEPSGAAASVGPDGERKRGRPRKQRPEDE